jgi:pyruvate dehydrogenase E2 component (dihydrolipoyllysine-residue acetyltransferase)
LSEGGGPTKLGMPKWGLSMTEGTVVEWLVEEGTELNNGDEVVEVESEKINNAVETPAPGVLRRRVAKEGDVLPVGGMLGVIADASVSDEEIDAYVEEFQANFVPSEEEAGGPEPETVEIGGKNIQYLKLGEGEGVPLVLLHGFGGDINIWVFNQEALAEGGRTVYAVDLPGHGGSTKDVGEGDLASLVRVVEGFMGEMGVEKAHLFGHSMGGAVAASLAIQHPEKVQSLSLIASAGLGEEINGDYIEGFIAANRRKEMKNALGLLFATPDLVNRQLVNDVIRFKRLDGVDEALRKLADNLFPNGKQADVPDLSGVEVPMLVVWGREDKIVPVAHSENAPTNARVEVLDDTGHMPQMEAAGQTNRLIGEFLDGQDG